MNIEKKFMKSIFRFSELFLPNFSLKAPNKLFKYGQLYNFFYLLDLHTFCFKKAFSYQHISIF